jgi:hypothetical protein
VSDNTRQTAEDLVSAYIAHKGSDFGRDVRFYTEGQSTAATVRLCTRSGQAYILVHNARGAAFPTESLDFAHAYLEAACYALKVVRLLKEQGYSVYE